MNHLEMQKHIEKLLRDNGFYLIDFTDSGQGIYRQNDDNPKMDIVIEFIRHNDDL